MKKLLLILCLIMASCSTEEKEPEVVEFEYIASLVDDCMSTDVVEINISEDNYRSLSNWDIPDCEIFREIPNKDRSEWFEGYLIGLRTTNPKY